MREKAKGLGVEVDSAGTAAYHVGEQPDPRSIDIAKKYHIDISQLRGRQFSAQDFDRFDVIYAMDASNYQNVLRQARNEADKSKVRMILNEAFPGEDMEVPDPYYGGDQGFEDVYKMLDNACEVILNNYQNDK